MYIILDRTKHDSTGNTSNRHANITNLIRQKVSASVEVCLEETKVCIYNKINVQKLE
jgi:hypothetical protein